MPEREGRKARGRKRFFFEKKKQKTFPGCFARSVIIEPRSSTPRAFERLNACGAWSYACKARRGEAALRAMKSFLALFFKKELLRFGF
jgi:hypothetical protein